MLERLMPKSDEFFDDFEAQCKATVEGARKLLALLGTIDEPELGLHPYAIAQLADMLRAIARTGSQIMVATQSVTLLDQFMLADPMVVEHGPSGTVVGRPDLESLRHRRSPTPRLSYYDRSRHFRHSML